MGAGCSNGRALVFLCGCRDLSSTTIPPRARVGARIFSTKALRRGSMSTTATPRAAKSGMRGARATEKPKFLTARCGHSPSSSATACASSSRRGACGALILAATRKRSTALGRRERRQGPAGRIRARRQYVADAGRGDGLPAVLRVRRRRDPPHARRKHRVEWGKPRQPASGAVLDGRADCSGRADAGARRRDRARSLRSRTMCVVCLCSTGCTRASAPHPGGRRSAVADRFAPWWKFPEESGTMAPATAREPPRAPRRPTTQRSRASRAKGAGRKSQ